MRRCEVDYLRPARLDDRLDVFTRPTALGGASADLEQIVKRDGTTLARLVVRLAFVTPAGRPARLPGAFRTALERFLQSQPGA